MAGIELTGLVKEFAPGTRAIDGVDLEIADGEFFALLGPSGCGKTTLLRGIAGLEALTAGRVRIGERDVTALDPAERRVAMVFQDYALFPHMTVEDNVAYPLRILRRPRAERDDAVRATATELGLEPYLGRRPAQLSGGQQQRVALARAVVARPEVFLFDEPLSNLDARMRLEARTFLSTLQRELGITTIFVTHDQAEALAMSHRIAVMRDGRIEQVGSPREVFRRPETVFVASFIGSTPMNLVPAQVSAGDGDHLELGESTAPGGTRPRIAAPPSCRGLPGGHRVLLGLRPEYLGLVGQDRRPDGGDTLAGTVIAVASLGASALVTLDTDIGQVGVVVGEDHEPELGDRCLVTVEPRRLVAYDQTTERLLPAPTPPAPAAGDPPAPRGAGSLR